MLISKFDITFANSTDLNGVEDKDSFLYLNTTNTGSLVFTPTVNATITPGTLVPWAKNLKPVGSVFYWYPLDTILSDEQIEGIVFDSGWETQHYEDEQNGVYWAFTPKEPIALKANQVLTLPISNIVVTAGKNLPCTTLTVQYYNVDGLTGKGDLNHRAYSFSVTLRDPPDTKPPPNLNDTLEILFLNGNERDFEGHKNVEFVEISLAGMLDVVNHFTLQVRPKLGQLTVVAGAGGATLVVSFVGYATPFGALASAADLAGIRVTRGEGADHWTIQAIPDDPGVDGSLPYWIVGIPEGQPLSGQLVFDNVVTHLEWGWTDLVVQYQGFVGYRPGQFACPMYKYVNSNSLEVVLYNAGEGTFVLQPDKTWVHGGVWGIAPPAQIESGQMPVCLACVPGDVDADTITISAQIYYLMYDKYEWVINFEGTWETATGKVISANCSAPSTVGEIATAGIISTVGAITPMVDVRRGWQCTGTYTFST